VHSRSRAEILSAIKDKILNKASVEEKEFDESAFDEGVMGYKKPQLTRKKHSSAFLKKAMQKIQAKIQREADQEKVLDEDENKLMKVKFKHSHAEKFGDQMADDVFEMSKQNALALDEDNMANLDLKNAFNENRKKIATIETKKVVKEMEKEVERGIQTAQNETASPWWISFILGALIAVMLFVVFKLWHERCKARKVYRQMTLLSDEMEI